MILGKIKQKQRILFSLRICFDLVHLLNEFLKVGPAFGDVIVPKMRIVYLNPFQNCNIRYIRLKGNRALLLERVKILTTFQVGNAVSYTKLNWPRKNGPSSNFDSSASSLSRAATDDETYMQFERGRQYVYPNCNNPFSLFISNGLTNFI